MMKKIIKTGINYFAAASLVLASINCASIKTKLDKSAIETKQNKTAILFTGDTAYTASNHNKNVYLVNLDSNYENLIKLGYNQERIHIFFPNQTRYHSKKPTKKGLLDIVDSISSSSPANSELLILLDGHGILYTETSEDIESGNAYYLLPSDSIRVSDLDSLCSLRNNKPTTLILNYCFSGDQLLKINPKQRTNVFASDSGTRTIRTIKSDFARTLLDEMTNPNNDLNSNGDVSYGEAFESTFKLRREFLEKFINNARIFSPEAAETQKIRALPSARINEDRVVYKINR